MGAPQAAPQTGKGGGAPQVPNSNNGFNYQGAQPGGAPASNNYYGGFQQSGNIFDQSAAGMGGAMNAAFQGLNYQPMANNSSGNFQGGGFGGAFNPGNAMANYNPANIQGGSYGSQTLANTDLGQYTNQWDDNVIQNSTRDMDRARKMQQMDTGGQFGNSFGGSRHGLAEAENNRNFYQSVGDMSDRQRQAGFQNAQQMAMGDISNQNQASQFNIGTDMQSQLANSQNQWNKANAMNQNEMNNAQLANQAGIAAGNNATSRWNNAQNMDLQAAQHRLNSAGQLAQFSNMGFGMGNTANQNMGMQGAIQQAQQQAMIDAAKRQWQQQQGFGGQGLDWMNQATSGAQAPQGSTSTSNPGLLDYAGTALGAYAAFSDINLKVNLKPTGRKYRNSEFDEFTWEWNEIAKRAGADGDPTTGVIAQTVQRTRPDLVHRGEHGYLMVNYGGIQ